ncbi:uncharacterized protein LOC123564931 [Mercenaria mercenaria]|uniref:uncharacterized protein LOC123564931 n=1 Tax=Mercenaria mercenaria TaxID=6596 RepID=UPI00234EB520|nr:uncharacterized protein LOC123564931 [Mercenaria mercenaria]
MLTVNSSHYQYIFSNSVDSFLRYHEKPKVEIQYSEAEDALPGEGLYSFAVRPSKIQKRRKDTADAIKQVHVTTLSPSKLLGPGTENGHGRCEIKVKYSSTLPSKPDDGTFSGTCRNKVYPVIKTPAINAFLSEHTAAKDLNSHVLSPDNNTISAFGTVSGVVVPRTNTMLTFGDELSTICSIARVSLQYFCLYKSVGSPVIPLIHKYHRFEKICSLFVPQCQRQRTLANISIQAEKYSYTVQSVSKTTLSIEIYGHTVPSVCQTFTTTVKNIPVLEYICDSTLKINYDNPKRNEVQKTSHDTISDASEDDSAFGILSVYCNSEIHYRYGNISKAEV